MPFIKNLPPAAGFSEVRYPDEIKHRRAEQVRRCDGIFVYDETRAQISGLMQSLEAVSR